MYKTLSIAFILLIFSSLSFGNEEAPDVLGMYANYLNATAAGKHEQALKVAYDLNGIDPSDTQALLYIVLSSLKSGKDIPSWIFDKPWPDATGQDVFNRRLAEHLVNGT
jgi:hypothetical protein